MPRSGTTLIERILSSHSKIYGAGELIFLPQIVDKIILKIIKILMKLFLKLDHNILNK